MGYIINKGINDSNAQVTVVATCVSAVTAGIPVYVYKTANGFSCTNKAIVSATATMRGFEVGITTASCSATKQTQIVIGGKVAVAVSAGTAGDQVTGIGVDGTCTTVSAGTGIGVNNIYGYLNSAKEIILVG